MSDTRFQLRGRVSGVVARVYSRRRRLYWAQKQGWAEWPSALTLCLMSGSGSGSGSGKETLQGRGEHRVQGQQRPDRAWKEGRNTGHIIN